MSDVQVGTVCGCICCARTKTKGKRKKDDKSLSRPLVRANELELRTGFWRVRESATFLNGLPFFGDHPQCLVSIPGNPRFNEPTTNDHTGPADASSTMDRSDTAPLFIVFEYSKNIPHILNRFGQRPIDYGEPVVFNVGEAHRLGARREIGFVSSELINFREVYERSDTGCEQSFYLLSHNTRTPGVFTGEEERCGPVRVWNRAFEDCVYGGMLLLLRKQNIDAVLGSRESGTR